MHPPTVAWRTVAGSGAKNNWCPALSRRWFSSSIVSPASASQVREASSIAVSARRFGDRSRTTARFVHCPASEVPPPRGRIGIPRDAQNATALAASRASAGMTTPSGSTW